MTQGSVKDTTGYVNYVYNISARGTTQVASQLMGLSGVTGTILGQLAFQTSSYLSETEGALLSMGVASVTGFTKATQKAMEFDQALSTISAISGKSGSSIDELGQQAMDMSAKFGIAVGEMTKGLESLARAGVSTGNMNAILEQAMGLSKLEGLSLETAINDLISTTNLLDTKGLDLESPEYAEAIRAQNQKITATSEAAPINAQDIIHTLEHVGGYASSTNIDQDDLFAVIAQLGSKGTKSEIAGTSLRAFLAAGQKDTAQRALKRIGLDVSDLWKDDEQILSITDMKDVLDEAMEAKGYTKQEKLEFYSDFAGYKQANQIMKIDTTSAREFKEKIDKSWDIGKKIQTVIGTAETNFQGMVQAGINFFTKVGKPLLPIVSTISWTIKTAIGLIDKIPGSHLIVGAGMILVGVKAISTIFNKIVPQLLQGGVHVGNMSEFFADIKDNLSQSLDILKAIGNEKAMKDIALNNEVENVKDADRMEYYQSLGYDVKTTDEIIKLKSKADDEKIVAIKRKRLKEAQTLHDKKTESTKTETKDKDSRVGANRKKPKEKPSYEEITKPINDINKTLTDIHGVLNTFTANDGETAVGSEIVNVDLSSVNKKLDSLIQATSVLYSISNDLNVENKAQLDDNIISDLKRHIWSVKVVGPVATLTKAEREKVWKSEGISLDDFIKKTIETPKQSQSTTKETSKETRTTAQHKQSTKAPDRSKGTSGYISANDVVDINAPIYNRNTVGGITSSERDYYRRKSTTSSRPQYGDTPTPDYAGDKSYGFERSISHAKGKSSFDVGVSVSDFRKAHGKINQIIRKYDRQHKGSEIKNSLNLADLYLEDANSVVIQDITKMMQKRYGDKAEKYLSDFFKQMTPIRTRGSMRLKESEFTEVNIDRTGSNALDTVIGHIEQGVHDTQEFLNTSGHSFRTDLNVQQIEKELNNVVGQVLNIVGQERLNLQETNPQELQEYELSPRSFDKTNVLANKRIINDALGVSSGPKLEHEKFARKMKEAMLLGSLQQSPLMRGLKGLQEQSEMSDSQFMTNVIRAYNSAMKDHEDLTLSHKSLNIGKNGKIIKGKNGGTRLENIVYSLAMDSTNAENQVEMSNFIIDFINNLKDLTGEDDYVLKGISSEVRAYDSKIKKENIKDFEENAGLMTEMSEEYNIYTIDSANTAMVNPSSRAYDPHTNVGGEAAAGRDWGIDPNTYTTDIGDEKHGEGMYGAVRDKDMMTSVSGGMLSQIIFNYGVQIETIARILNDAQSNEDDKNKALETLEYFLSQLSQEEKNSLIASYGISYARHINESATDPSAAVDNRYYNSPFGRNTAFFNGVELGEMNDKKANFEYHLMHLYEKIDPLIKKIAALKHEVKTAEDISFLQSLGLIGEDYERAVDFLRRINKVVADIHVKGKALQGRHRGYRGLGDASTAEATLGVAIREQGNIAADKDVAKVLPDEDTPDRNYVKEKLQRRSLSSIAHLVAPIYGRAGLPETGGMKLPIEHVTGFSGIPWLMQRAKTPTEVMYELSRPDEHHNTGVWYKNDKGNYANIWTPEAMMKRLAASTMGNVIENLGALTFYDNGNNIITSANVKNIASKLTPQMMQSVEFMYGQQGFTSLRDLKMKAGDKYDPFIAEVHKRMDTAAPEEGFTPDEQANNQFKRWVNDKELDRLEQEGLLDKVLDDSNNAITRTRTKDGEEYQQHLVYDWEALRLSKEEIGQQYTVMMMANVMHAYELMTEKLAMADSVFDEFQEDVQNLAQNIVVDPKKFLGMKKDDLIAYGVNDDKAFYSISQSLDVLKSTDPNKINSLLQNLTVGDLGSEFVDRLEELGYYNSYDDEDTFYATSVATIAESFGGTYELVFEMLQSMVFEIDQMRDMIHIFDSEGKIKEYVSKATIGKLLEHPNTTATKIKKNIRQNKKKDMVLPTNVLVDPGMVSLGAGVEMDPITGVIGTDSYGNLVESHKNLSSNRSDIPYKPQDFTPDMWKRSMAEDPIVVSDIWEELKDYLQGSRGLSESARQVWDMGFDQNIVNFAKSSNIAQQYMDDLGGFTDIEDVKRDLYKFLGVSGAFLEGEHVIKTRIDEEKEELDRMKKDAAPSGYDSGYHPHETGHISPTDVSMLDNNMETAFIVNRDAVKKSRHKRMEDEKKQKNKEKGYITPDDASIIDDNIGATFRISNDARLESRKETANKKRKKKNESHKLTKGTMPDYEQQNRNQIKSFIKIGIRNHEIGSHVFADTYLDVAHKMAESEDDFNALYKEAEKELIQERKEAQEKMVRDADSRSRETKTAKNKRVKKLADKSVQKKNKGAKANIFDVDANNEHNRQVRNQNDMVRENLKIAQAIQDQQKEQTKTQTETETEKTKNKTTIPSTQYNEEELLEFYGLNDKEYVKRSNVGHKDYKDYYNNSSEIDELIRLRNEAAWKDITTSPIEEEPLSEKEPLTAKGKQGKKQAENLFDYIRQQTDRVSTYIGQQAEKRTDTSKVKDAMSILGKTNSRLSDSAELLKGANSALEELANSSTLFAPLLVAVMGIQTVISTIESFTSMSTKIQGFIAQANDPKSDIIKLFNKSVAKDSNAGKLLINISGALSTAITTITTLITDFLGPIILITAAIFGIKTALDQSYQSHKKYLQELEDEEKTNKSRSKALATTTEQSKKAMEQNKYAQQQDRLNRNYELNKQRLTNANLSRTSGSVKLTEAQNDTLWGKYGITAALDKIQGKYESTASEYDGTSGQTRRIKESTVGGQGLIRGMPGYYSPAQGQVAAYYDANQLAFGVMDEYKDELGELYDTETNIMKKDKVSSAEARRTQAFEKALDKFTEATGITRDHAKQYLDYMQTEHNVDKAVQAMQAQADNISATTEMKIQALKLGGNPSDILGLNGIEAQQNAMVKAQADIIQLEISSALWWKAVWSTITSPVRAIISPIFAIANLLSALWSFITGNWDDAWQKAGKAGASLNVLGETATYWGAWGEAESTDFNAIGQGAVDEYNRANYGNANTTTASSGFTHYYGTNKGKQKGGHGIKEHGAILKQNAQQSFFSQLIGGITATLGTIVTILIGIAAIDVGSKLLKLIGGSETIKQYAGRVIPTINKYLPESVKKLYGRAKGIAGPIAKFFGIDKISNFIGKHAPDSVKGIWKGAKDKWGKVKEFFGAGKELPDEEDINNTSEEKATVEQNVSNITNYVKNIWESIKKGLSLNNDITDENKRNLFGNLDFYMPDRLDNILNDIQFGTFYDEDKGSAETRDMGRKINFNTAKIKSFGEDKEGAAEQFVADYIHEISHSILKHAVRQTSDVPNGLGITRTDDNYDYRTSELESRTVVQDFFADSGMINPHENSTSLEEDIQKAIDAGTYEEFNGALVGHLSMTLGRNKEQVLNDLVAVIEQSDDEYLLSIKDAVIQLITDDNDGFGVSLTKTKNNAKDIIDENRRGKTPQPIDEEWEWYNNADAISIDDLSPANQFRASPKTAIKNQLEEMTTPWDDYLANKVTSLKENFIAPWDDYLSTGVKNYAAYELYDSKEREDLNVWNMDYSEIEDLAAKHNIDISDASNQMVGRGRVERGLKESGKYESALDDVYHQRKVGEVEKRGAGSIFKERLTNNYIDPWKQYAKDQAEAKYKDMMANAEAYRERPDLFEDASTTTKIIAKGLDVKDKIFGKGANRTSIKEALQDPAKMEELIKNRLDEFESDSTIGRYRDKAYKAKELMQDPQAAMQWAGEKYKEATAAGDEEYQWYKGGGLEYKDLSFVNKIRSIKEEQLGIGANDSITDILQDPEKTVEMARKLSSAYKNGDLEGTINMEDFSFTDIIKNKMSGIFNAEEIKDAVEEGIDEGTEGEGGGLFDSAKKKLAGLFGDGEEESVGEKTKIPIEGENSGEQDIPIKKKPATEPQPSLIDKTKDKLNNLSLDNIKDKGSTILSNAKDKISSFTKYPLSSHISNFKLQHQGGLNRLGMIKDKLMGAVPDSITNKMEGSRKGITGLKDKVSNLSSSMGETVKSTLGSIKGKFIKEYKYCEHCGHKNPADAEFCENCGMLINEDTIEQGKKNSQEKVKTQGSMLTQMHMPENIPQHAATPKHYAGGKGSMLTQLHSKDAISETSLKSEFTFCGSCGGVIHEGDEFCNWCGARVNAEAYCPECGAGVGVDDEYCQACGTALNPPSKAQKAKQKLSGLLHKFEDKINGKENIEGQYSIQRRVNKAVNSVQNKIAGTDQTEADKDPNSIKNRHKRGEWSEGMLEPSGHAERKPKDDDVTLLHSDDPNKQGAIVNKVKENVNTAKAYAEKGISLFKRPSTDVESEHAFANSGFSSMKLTTLPTYGNKEYKEEMPGATESSPSILNFDENEKIQDINGKLKTGGNIAQKVGGFLKGRGGKAGKVGDIVSRIGGGASKVGEKGIGGVAKTGISKLTGGKGISGAISKVGGSKVGGIAKTGMGKLAKTGVGKAVGGVGKKIAMKAGTKLATKAGAQVASKVLAGGLAATGIGAPLAAIMASPIGGFLVEGAMNLGGKALGAVGGLAKGAMGAVGGLLGFGKKSHYYGKKGGLFGGRGGRGGPGLMGAMMPGLGMLGMAGGLLGGIFGGKGAKNMGKFGGLGLMAAMSPFGMMVGLLGKIHKDNKLKHGKTDETNDRVGKILKALLDNKKPNNDSNVSGGNITIQNININTADDPEAIKAMFLELIIELQEQINPRIVSRTIGKPSSTSETDTSNENANDESTTDTNPSSSNSNTRTNNSTK